MKTILKNYCTTKQAQIFTALILTGILSISSGFTLLKSAIAAPRDILPETANEILKVNASNNGLPQPVARAVLRDVSRTQGILPNKLEITEFSQKTWRNGCLDLPKPGEFCTQALVPGWQVMVSDGSQTWIYHTNSNGRSLRLANPNTPPNNQSDNLPTSVRDNVLAAASKFTGLPTSQLRIVKVGQLTTDGCLGLPRPDEACIQIAQQAWEVTVQAGKQRLVYRANRDGSQVRLNETASLISIPKPITNKESVKPVPIPSNELPPPLESGIVFRQISSGGFIGRTYETVLLDDGRLIRVRIGDANDSERSVRRVSQQQVRRFQKLLEEKGSSEFQNLNYPAPSGAADYTSYTLTSSDGTVQYNDISQNRLPENLRFVLKAWNQLLSSAQS
ncbi:MAG: hypothetical protein HXY43_00895 [Fischerella sp.]|uniref:hypothetical protein n=1 Tax=Fischerella sp. TaxID=1191 RepID=UPI00184A084D|nr:hypothetical protein [Fischerella sp.]NWF57900.1 hypothetical protein [Fischerella sp.]